MPTNIVRARGALNVLTNGPQTACREDLVDSKLTSGYQDETCCRFIRTMPMRRRRLDAATVHTR
eukprot:scaffold242058_cov29-Tisochrysis_lutea.AAC.3